MELLLQDCTGPGRARMLPNCTATFFSLSLTPMTTATTTTAAAAATAPAAFFNIIITHLLHSHIHCDLNHSCSKLTPRDLHLFLNPRRPHLPPPRDIFPSSDTSTQLAALLFSNLPPSFFKPPAIFSNLPGEGREDLTKKVEGVILLLRKSLPPLGWTPPLYYYRKIAKSEY